LGGCSEKAASAGDREADNAQTSPAGTGTEEGVGDVLPASSRESAAATATAETNAGCLAAAPFYWEIGDASGMLASGSVGEAAPVASTLLSIASASKWLFSAYAVQKMGGTPAATYIPFFNLTSGYTGFGACPASGTIDDCLAGAAGMESAADVGKFYYDSGHFQKLASLLGLGADDNAALAAEVESQIGPEIQIGYTQPEPAAGVQTSADQYVLFLRRLLVGSPNPLLIGPLLGSDAVCTEACSTAVFSPISNHWHYSLGHWVEDDPAVGDGAFSSPGRTGFYPWVNATRTNYGVLARDGASGSQNSTLCGSAIRKAWTTGVAQ